MHNSAKRVNYIFLLVILIHISFTLFLSTFGRQISFGIVANLISSQLMILLPGLLYFVSKDTKMTTLVPFKKLKISSICIIVLFSYLTMPLISLINAFTLFFTDNTVYQISDTITSKPTIVMFLLIGVFGPFCEEFVFRGIFYHGYKQSGKIISAIVLSSLLFGLMHLNFNQMAYAVVIGIICCLLVEATGSIFAAWLIHTVINGHNVLMLYLSESILKVSEKMQGALGEYGGEVMQDISPEALMTTDMLIQTVCILAVVATVTTTLAVCVYIWLCKNESSTEHIKAIFKRKPSATKNINDMSVEDIFLPPKKTSLISPSFIIAAIICMGYMIMIEVIKLGI